MRLRSLTIRQAYLDRFPPIVQVHVARGLAIGTLRLHGVEADVPFCEMGWRR